MTRASSDNGAFIEAPRGRAAFVSIGANGVRDALRIGTTGDAQVARMDVGGRPIAYLFGAPRGVSGAALSVGAQDNSAVGVFAVGRSSIDVSALVARGRLSQRADLQQWQGHDAKRLLSVDARGRLRWAAENSTLAAGEAGNAAGVPARPVKYLEVRDSGGTALLIPAYAKKP